MSIFRIHIKHPAILIASLIIAGLLSACATASNPEPEELTPVQLQLSWFHEYSSAPLHVAAQKGYFADEGLDVDLIGGDDLDGDGISDALSLRDTDGDGTPDALDTDSDGDGIDDWQEIFGFAPTGFDSDGDGIDDAIDVDQVGGEDLNGDGIADALMNLSDLDGDGLPAYLDSDADGDGLSDGVELGDYDGDGIPDNEQSPSEIETALSGSGAGYKGLGLLLLAAVVAGVYRRTHPKGKHHKAHHNGHHKSSHGPSHGNQGHSSQSQNKQSQIQKGSDKGTSE